jgi:Zn-finger nucleic acid-binding protein
LIRRALKARADNPDRALDLPRRRGSNPFQQKVQYRKCPECDAFMQRMNFQRSSGVILDRCAEHGTWLDADELEQIVGFLLAGGAKDYKPHVSGNAQKVAEAFAKMQVVDIQKRYERRDDMNDGLLGVLSKLLR